MRTGIFLFLAAILAGTQLTAFLSDPKKETKGRLVSSFLIDLYQSLSIYNAQVFSSSNGMVRICLFQKSTSKMTVDECYRLHRLISSQVALKSYS